MTNPLEVLPITKETISTSGGDFAVGALSVAGIIGIFTRHRATLGELFVRYKAQEDMQDVAIALVTDAPEIAAEIIVCGAGPFSEAALMVAKQLDFGTQLLALEAIAKLTTASHGGLGNLVAAVTRIAETATTGLKQATTATVE